MIHEPATPVGQAAGSLSSVSQTHRLMRDFFRTLARILAQHTGQPLGRIRTDMQRTRWITAEGALRYGFIDALVPVRKGLPESIGSIMKRSWEQVLKGEPGDPPSGRGSLGAPGIRARE
jgi:ATP-dependent Clp protease protease subunit